MADYKDTRVTYTRTIAVSKNETISIQLESTPGGQVDDGNGNTWSETIEDLYSFLACQADRALAYADPMYGLKVREELAENKAQLADLETKIKTATLHMKRIRERHIKIIERYNELRGILHRNGIEMEELPGYLWPMPVEEEQASRTLQSFYAELDDQLIAMLKEQHTAFCAWEAEHMYAENMDMDDYQPMTLNVFFDSSVKHFIMQGKFRP